MRRLVRRINMERSDILVYKATKRSEVQEVSTLVMVPVPYRTWEKSLSSYWPLRGNQHPHPPDSESYLSLAPFRILLLPRSDLEGGAPRFKVYPCVGGTSGTVQKFHNKRKHEKSDSQRAAMHRRPKDASVRVSVVLSLLLAVFLFYI